MPRIQHTTISWTASNSTDIQLMEALDDCLNHQSCVSPDQILRALNELRGDRVTTQTNVVQGELFTA